MDEPTTGLHVENIKKRLAMLQKLLNSGKPSGGRTQPRYD